MKKVIVILLIIFFCTLTFASCKDKGDEQINATANASKPSFSCLVDGVRFSSDFVSGQVSEQVQNILITAQKNDGKIVQLFVPIITEPGTYTLGNPLGDVFVQAYYGVDEERVGLAILPEDKLTISSHDKATRNITGGFTFESKIDGVGTFLVTEGNFDINY